MRRAFLCLASLLAATLAVADPALAIVADHKAAGEFDELPPAWFDTVRGRFDTFYGHTSHGSQLVTGMQMLRNEDATLYAPVALHEYGDDLGTVGDTSWATLTRAYLDSNPDCNLVLWSWCGGVSDNTVEGIDLYLETMSQLEADYRDVVFVYMTGHLDGTGPDGNLRARNDQIRAFCRDHDKTLYDFADIENYDPDGVFHPDASDACEWCTWWCGENECPNCSECAHSHCFNCYRKGRAFWWLLARLAGWQSTVAVAGVPARGGLLQPAWPNPFNPATTIAFSLPVATEARLTVLDGRGAEIAELVAGSLAAGRHEVVWRGCDDHGRPVSSGTYVCRLEAGGGVATQKLTLLK